MKNDLKNCKILALPTSEGKIIGSYNQWISKIIDEIQKLTVEIKYPKAGI